MLDKNLKKLEKRLGVSLSVRGDRLMIEGPSDRVEFAKNYFNKINDLRDRGHLLNQEDFGIALDLLEEGREQSFQQYAPPEPLTLSRKSVAARSRSPSLSRSAATRVHRLSPAAYVQWGVKAAEAMSALTVKAHI